MFGISFASAPIGSSYSVTTGLCGPLMKSTTAGELEDILRVEMNLVGNDKFTSQLFLDLMNHSCDFLKEKLGIGKIYVCFTTLGVGTSFDLSSVKMRGILKVVDSSAGVVKMVSPEEYQRVSGFGGYTSSVFGVQEGETLRLTYGSSVTPGTVRLYYLRHILPVTSRNDYPDLPDSYTRLLIETVKRNLN